MSNDFDRNSEPNAEFYPALYSLLKQRNDPKFKPVGSLRVATQNEDWYDKKDVFIQFEGLGEVPFQTRCYGEVSAEFDKGFPVRSTDLKYGSEMKKLLAGELDDVWFAFATTKINKQGAFKYKFPKVKIVKGSSLKNSAVTHTRVFSNGNEVSYLADPTDTIVLRNWE